jgi:hypothetical protein
MLERFMEKIKRRTLVCAHLSKFGRLSGTRALAAGTHEDWTEAMPYLNMATKNYETKRPD